MKQENRELQWKEKLAGEIGWIKLLGSVRIQIGILIHSGSRPLISKAFC